MKIIIINGPNLNLLGQRETSVYGESSFDDYFPQLQSRFSGVEIECFQSNIEGEIIDKLHQTGFTYDGIILNAAAYTHTSIGIADAVKAISAPVVEIHISNVYAREEFRHHSFIAPYAKGIIVGFGLQGYQLGVQSLINI
jgi:3-dehydroquinate dehydratase-2